MKRFLIIQTAFIGDVILATAIVEQLHAAFPNAKIDFLLRKGNESLLFQHPFINDVLIWDKKKGKYANLFRLLHSIRQNNYDEVINLQRFTATGLLTVFAGAKRSTGFRKNPLSLFFSQRIAHQLGNGTHEVDRNLQLIKHLCEIKTGKPKLYPSTTDKKEIEALQQKPYICMAPASVWFTKQLPVDKWVELIDGLADNLVVYLIGAPSDQSLCEAIQAKSQHQQLTILAGKLTFLQSAALMEKARMNYTNDSAPMHIASAMNAPTTAIFCSTVPEFGFGPLSTQSTVLQTPLTLACRPCGLHGRRACPEGHFNCAHSILFGNKNNQKTVN
jgi:lipopolysaccharide heptosyltransferase II